MKDATSTDLVKQRDDLLAKIASERVELSQNGTSMRPLMKLAGRVSGVVRYLGHHPEILILPAAMMTLSRPRRLIGMAISGWSMWRVLRKMRRNLDTDPKG